MRCALHHQVLLLAAMWQHAPEGDQPRVAVMAHRWQVARSLAACWDCDDAEADRDAGEGEAPVVLPVVRAAAVLCRACAAPCALAPRP